MPRPNTPRSSRLLSSLYTRFLRLTGSGHPSPPPAYHLYTDSAEREYDEILSVRYEDGRWSKPYYDCGGGNIWMLTYTVPFFGYDNGTYFFK